MDILIAAGGMEFGPLTPNVKSLGGSETSAIQLAERLAELDQDVIVFSQLPMSGPDKVEHGQIINGVKWMHLDSFQQYSTATPHDLLIAQRDPKFISINTQSRKKVLWVHDIATHRGMTAAINQIQFAIDEIWTVSEWHRQQIHEVTDYPLDKIVPLRNGIVAFDDEDFWNELDLIERDPKQFFYAARPERGLVALVRPGGIMSYLQDSTLKIAMYAHFPPHMQEFYDQIFQWVEDSPNCEFVDGRSLSQADMRRALKGSVAYLYPTAFEETSCIIARECIETLTPFLSTGVGALTETMGDCGIFYEDWAEITDPDWEPSYDDDEFCKNFAGFVKASLSQDHENSNLETVVWAVHEMTKRTDLYWDGVAELVMENAMPKEPTVYSRAWSMIQDGDVIPAEAFLRNIKENAPDAMHRSYINLLNQIYECYPFVFGDVTMEDHYNFLYEDGNNNDELEWTVEYTHHPRINEVRAALKTLSPGSLVMEYGCGAGHMIAPLAIEFPMLDFVGIDINQPCVDVINNGAIDHDVSNLRAVQGDQENSATECVGKADFIWCSEVLEHVIKPWEVMEEVEGYVKDGGYALFTTPFGPWEPMTFMRPGEWLFRAHIWEVDKKMISYMIEDKEESSIAVSPVGCSPDGRIYGNYIFSYKVDHKSIPEVDPIEKAAQHHSRQTCAAAVIAMNNEDTIVKMLNSLDWLVQHVNIALGPSKDNTRSLVEEWFAKHRYITYKIIDVPKITPPKGYPNGEGEGFGFDDARNASMEGLEAYDWALWIDTDEYLVGNFSPLLRSNSLDSYLITQHHFTVEPRGEPAQLDRPARLIRTTSGFSAKGHIHEHFEVEAGGPGRGFLLPDVDIGHTGYENEEVRRTRFARNFPFLQWDHDDHPERRLHPFLWFRDIIHRVRYHLMEDQKEAAFHLAKEGIEYYNDHWKEMSTFGPGTFQALEYIAELNRYMDKGLGVNITLALEDGKSLQFNTKSDNYEELERVLKEVLLPEYERRNSRYY